jgi:hypothetical protein
MARGYGAGCMSLAAALFIGLMIATAGTAIYPRSAAVGAALLCGGEVRYESRGASYRPGEYTVTRQIYCQTGSGKEAEGEEITFRAVGLSFLIYSAAFFLLLRFVAAPLMRRKLEQTLAAAGPASDLRDMLARASAPRDDIADRLSRLNALREQGLITDEDYETKKAEILTRI